jgi:hypothetical protein
MIWDKSRGFEIIDVVTRSKHYYCRQCIDVEKRKVTLFSTASGTRSILQHWRKIHFTDEDGTPIPKGNIQEALVNQGRTTTMATICWIADFEVLKALLLRWLVYCHIAFFVFENVYFLALLRHLNP